MRGAKHFITHTLLLPYRSGRLLRTLRTMPAFFRQWREFNKTSGARAALEDIFPCLDDAAATTPFDPHYFYQSAWAARKIAQHAPSLHIDVGSQIDLIAPLSAFVDVEFVDVRPLVVELPRLRCRRGSILALPYADGSVSSLSSLHVVEHIGLGRYGDPLDPEGTRKACAELKRVLAKGGRLYVSTPVGYERVAFNAHRVHSPATIMQYFDSLVLQEFSCVDDDGLWHPVASPDVCATFTYGLGMFHFEKL